MKKHVILSGSILQREFALCFVFLFLLRKVLVVVGNRREIGSLIYEVDSSLNRFSLALFKNNTSRDTV